MLRFHVDGMPQSKGSWRPVSNRRTGGIAFKADNEAEGAWAEQVAWAARAALQRPPVPDRQRYQVALDFTLLPPAGRGGRKNRRDIDKLARSVLDRDIGVLAERLQGVERRLEGMELMLERRLSALEAPGNVMPEQALGLERRIVSLELTTGWTRPTGSASLHDRIVNLTEHLGVLERDVCELANRDQRAAGILGGLRSRIDGLDRGIGPIGGRVNRLETDLRSAEAAIGELHKQAEDAGATPPSIEILGNDGMAIHTLHIEHLHVGDVADEDDAIGRRREVMGAAIAADLVALRRRREAADAKPITPELISRSSGEELDWIADRLGLARKESMFTGWIGGKLTEPGPEADGPLRLRCGAALFAQNMTRECAEAILRQAKEARYPTQAPGPAWHPSDWTIDAVMAAAGVSWNGWTIDAPWFQIGGKDPELAYALKASNERARALELALGHSGNDSTWASMINAVVTLRRERDDLQRQNRDLGHAVERTRADRDRLLKTSNEDVESLSRELGDLRNQRVELTAALDRAHARADEDRSALEARAVALKTTQAQIDNFMSACGDQAIQIMELRGAVRDLTAIADRAKAADMLIAAMPAWAEMASTTVALTYERPLLKVWDEVKGLVAPAPEPTESDPAAIEPLSGL